MRWILLPLLALPACTTAARIYPVDKVSDTMVLLRLVQVEAHHDLTVVALRYQAGEELRRVGVHAPGTKGAFVITDETEETIYKLVAVKGISVLPDRTAVEPGGTLEFTLTFEPIPETLARINIGEGRSRPVPGETAWHFLDVELKR